MQFPYRRFVRPQPPAPLPVVETGAATQASPQPSITPAGSKANMRRRFWGAALLGVAVAGSAVAVLIGGHTERQPPAPTKQSRVVQMQVEAPTAEPVTALVSGEPAAIAAAVRVLMLDHSHFAPEGIVTDGTEPVTGAQGGYQIRMHYQTSRGRVEQFLCEIIDGNGSCHAVTVATSSPDPHETTQLPANYYVGPRGGVYHFSPSGRKVYERRKK
jgi:hypothetical protein